MNPGYAFFLLLVFVFIESVAGVIIQRSIYFFTNEVYGFTSGQNLLLAVIVGIAYVLGALPSHRIARAVGQKRAMLGLVGLQALLPATAGLVGSAWAVVAMMIVFALLLGAMWPMAESFASAGRTPAQAQRAIGQYNLAWSTALPLGIAVSGWLIQTLHKRMLLVPAGLILLGGLILWRCLPDNPAHHPNDHPERPTAAQTRLFQALMRSSRWSMIASYALSFVLMPLLPGIIQKLGVGLVLGTIMASVLEVGRPVAFAGMLATARWHGRWHLLVLAAVVLPVSFAMVLLGSNAPVVLTGEMLFSLAAGVAYYAALYYAMVVSNASVDAGGAHEALIGAGFIGGPLCALVGQSIGAAMAQPVLGVALGVSPLMLVCLLAAVRPGLMLGRRGASA